MDQPEASPFWTRSKPSVPGRFISTSMRSTKRSGCWKMHFQPRTLALSGACCPKSKQRFETKSARLAQLTGAMIRGIGSRAQMEDKRHACFDRVVRRNSSGCPPGKHCFTIQPRGDCVNCRARRCDAARLISEPARFDEGSQRRKGRRPLRSHRWARRAGL